MKRSDLQHANSRSRNRYTYMIFFERALIGLWSIWNGVFKGGGLDNALCTNMWVGEWW